MKIAVTQRLEDIEWMPSAMPIICVKVDTVKYAA